MREQRSNGRGQGTVINISGQNQVANEKWVQHAHRGTVRSTDSARRGGGNGGGMTVMRSCKLAANAGTCPQRSTIRTHEKFMRGGKCWDG